jgi:hypothetical protein
MIAQESNPPALLTCCLTFSRMAISTGPGDSNIVSDAMVRERFKRCRRAMRRLRVAQSMNLLATMLRLQSELR